MSEMNVTRRNFLSGAALVSAAIAGAGLAGCAPQSAAPAASSSSAGEALGATGAANSTVGFDGTGTLPWLGEAPAISDDQVEEELTADVVVVGLGAAGVPAARAAAEAGAKVVCLESSSHLNSVASDMAIFGGQTQAQWGRGDGFLDKKMVVNMHMEECSHHVSQSVISRYYDESGAALDWFVGASKNLYMAPESYAEIPTDAQANYMFPYMYPVPETYDYTKDLPCYPTSVGFSSLATVMADNLQAAVDAGAEVRYSTKGVELILNDEGAVAGIYAQAAGSDGYLKITAQSVILATGDYLGNEDMMKFYAPECVENGINILSIDLDDEGNYTNVGEGHKMGAWAGAAIEQWHAPMIHHMGGGAGADGRGVIGNNGYLWLNLRGKRFMNDACPASSWRTRWSCSRSARPTSSSTPPGPSSWRTSPPPTAWPASTATSLCPSTPPPACASTCVPPPTSMRPWKRAAASGQHHRRTARHDRGHGRRDQPRPPSSVTTSWPAPARTPTSSRAPSACSPWRTAPSTPLSAGAPSPWATWAAWSPTRTATCTTPTASSSPACTRPAPPRAAASRCSTPSR